jgi:hypothetical protein
MSEAILFQDKTYKNKKSERISALVAIDAKVGPHEEKVLKTKKSVRKTQTISIGDENRYYDHTVTSIYKQEQISVVADISTDVTELQNVEKNLKS